MGHFPVETVLDLLTHTAFGWGHGLSCLASRANNTFSSWEEIRVKLALVELGLLRLQTTGLFTAILHRRGILWAVMWNFWLSSVVIWVLRWFFQHRSRWAKLRFILSASRTLWYRLTWALFGPIAIGTLLESHIIVWLSRWESGDREHRFLAILYYIFTELRRGLKCRCGFLVFVVTAAFTLAIDAFMIGVMQFVHYFFELLTA